MQQVGVREAKTNLSRMLKDVQRGRGYVITDHGQAVGMLVPMPQESRYASADQLLANLEANGVIEARKTKVRRLPAPARFRGLRAQQMLQQDRDAG